MRVPVVCGVLLLLVLAGCGGSIAGGAGPSTVGPPAQMSGSLLIIKGDNIFSTDGKQDVQLTHETNSNFANNPAFSPDGSLIAYTHHVAPQGSDWGGAELHVMQTDGSGDRTLVPAKAKGERAETPAWTPDGKFIYFAHDVPTIDESNRYTGDTLWVDRVELATGEVQAVVKDAVSPTIAPNGAFSWTVYNVNDSTFKLTVGSLGGSDGKVILTNKDFQAIWTPTLSPDGKTILFGGSGRTSSKVASVGSALADALNPIVPGTAQAHGLPWDPWTIAVDGNGLKRLANIGSDEMAMAWSPDGQEVAFSNLSATYLMRADGTGLNRLFARGDPGGLSWRS